MEGKRKDIEMNKIEVLEIECKRLQKMMETNEALCKEKSMEIEKKVREIEFSKSFIAERAKELDLKQKKIDDSFTNLEVKKRKFTEEKKEIKAKLAEVEERNLELNKKEEDINFRERKVKDVTNLLRKKHEEIIRQTKEIDTRKKCTEKYAEDLETKQKELEKGFKELNSKKTEYDDFNSSIAAKLAEIEERNSKLNRREEDISLREKKVNDIGILHKEKYEEIVRQMKEFDIRKKCMEKYAADLETREKELEKGFKELNSKKTDFDGFNRSIAETSMNPTKRKRTSSDQSPTRGAPMNTELPAPQVSHTVLNQNSNGGETFWTCCALCDFRFQYPKVLVNKEVTCRHCSTKFTASEMDAANLPHVDYLLENLKYFRKTDRIPGNNGEGGSGSV